MNGLIPRPLLREYTQEGRVHRVFQGAFPDVAYTDPGHGMEVIVELKFCTGGPTRHGRDVATSLRAAVKKREQQLYQEYLTQLRLKDRKYFHTPAGTVGGPLGARSHKSHQLWGELRGMGSWVLR